MDNIIDKLTDACIAHFNLEQRDLHSSTRKENVILAKHILWYVLHSEFGISAGDISKEFYRTKRQVFGAINKVKKGVKKKRYYKELYNSFMERIKEEHLCCTKGLN